MNQKINVCGKDITFIFDGLETPDRLQQIVSEVLTEAQVGFRFALERCTFFADRGYDALVEAAKHFPAIQDPRIEGHDLNPFDQHYWLAFDDRGTNRTVLIDPVFQYAGLEALASRVLDNDHIIYYRTKRRVVPHTARGHGGVLVKTIGI